VHKSSLPKNIREYPLAPQLALSKAEFMTTAQKSGTTEAGEAVEVLRGALTAAGIVLPSLGADTASPALNLINLGRVRADVALRLAEVLRRGCA